MGPGVSTNCIGVRGSRHGVLRGRLKWAAGKEGLGQIQGGRGGHDGADFFSKLHFCVIRLTSLQK